MERHAPLTARWLWFATLQRRDHLLRRTDRTAAARAGSDAAGPRARTESPYFFVKSDDPALDALPLKGTEVDVKISGVIADVTVTQTYRNEGQRAIEARYVFPGSTRAAVSGLNVRLADRLITAQIREKQQARIEYDAAKKEGKTAALLEQHLPNVFQMNVANILPGDDVKVELRYTELLVPQCRQLPVRVPDGGRAALQQPAIRAGAARSGSRNRCCAPACAPHTAFKLKVALDTPIGLKEVRSATHAIDVKKSDDDRHADIALAPTPRDRRQPRLRARLAPGRRAHRIGPDALQGPGRRTPRTSSSRWSSRPSRWRPARSRRATTSSWSTSRVRCTAFRSTPPRRCCERLIGGLRPSDTFNVLLFSGSNKMLAPQSVPATRANIDQALAHHRATTAAAAAPS